MFIRSIVHPAPRHLEPKFGGRQTNEEGKGETVARREVAVSLEDITIRLAYPP